MRLLQVNESIVVKLIPEVDRDGLPEKDPLGRPNERIGVREFVLAPGASVCFQRPDNLLPVPDSGNLTTFNPLVSQYHAWITAGPSNTSIWLTDLDSSLGTFLDYNEVRLNPPLSQHGTFFERIPRGTFVRVETGTIIRLGTTGVAHSGRIHYAPSWKLIVTRCDRDLAKLCEDAANTPIPTVRGPKHEHIQMIKFLPHGARDGMPERDFLGEENPHISPRELILAAGTGREFSLSDSLDGVKPATNNLYTYNENASSPHARVTAGTGTTIWLTDLSSHSGTFVDHNVPDVSRCGEHRVKWEKLQPNVPVEVGPGAFIRLGKDSLTSCDGGVHEPQGGVSYAPIWTLTVEPVKVQKEEE